ncbi:MULTISPECIES: hypothetical protein [Pseudofrankia]|uniref:hypothetical protein n=1 Tax=Pseudofrankia TaxID=2994363 RepID=UPI000234D68E|nr:MULTISPECIES: hypothetical protein [Pseudofrankia]OHV41262.1 hypothetical protein BCD49_06980 [Pseudofrankia sp. EUN1h]
MSDDEGGWLPCLGLALSHGPLVAFAVCLAVSPVVHALIARILERRWLSPRGEFVALLYGDPLLAVAAGFGVVLCPDGPSASVRAVVRGAPAWAMVAAWLAFGLWQWWAEVHSRLYVPAQAVAPTKIWHQLVVYPVLGYLVVAATVAGLASPGLSVARVLARITIVACVAAWTVANVYDRRHTKLGHPPYDWRRLRPTPPPWPRSSRSLRVGVHPAD